MSRPIIIHNRRLHDASNPKLPRCTSTVVHPFDCLSPKIGRTVPSRSIGIAERQLEDEAGLTQRLRAATLTNHDASTVHSKRAELEPAPTRCASAHSPRFRTHCHADQPGPIRSGLDAAEENTRTKFGGGWFSHRPATCPRMHRAWPHLYKARTDDEHPTGCGPG